MVIAGGIDLGGTKIEAQRFAGDWALQDKRRIDTPADYEGLLAAMADQIGWLRAAHPALPVGVAAAGLVNPADGRSIAANLSSQGRPFAADLAQRVGAGIVWLNDCRAFSLAEAVFGAGSDHGTMLGLLLGTGIGGAVTIDGRLINDGAGQSGEFGHMALPAALVARHKLPILRCGCGRDGCFETLGSGPGMERLAAHLLGRPVSARDIAAARQSDPRLGAVWDVWAEIVAALLHELSQVVDPSTVVLGGGLSQMPGLIPAIKAELARLSWPGFPLPAVRLAARGETAAALGAGYAAYSERCDA